MKAESYDLTRANFQLIISAIRDAILNNAEGKKQSLEIVLKNRETKAEKRNTIQNALMWHWNGEEANFNNKRDRHLGKEYTPQMIHQINKLDYGVPILSREIPFMEMWRQFRYHSRPAKIAMLKYIPITSIMDLDQMGEYLSTIKQDKEDNGVILTDRYDMEQEALGRGKRVLSQAEKIK